MPLKTHRIALYPGDGIGPDVTREALRALQAESEKTRERDAVLGNLTGASAYLSAAQTLYRLSTERPKNDLDRDPGFQERDWSRIRESQERMQRALDAGVDRALFAWAMGMAAALPADQRIAPLDEAAGLSAGMTKPEAEKAINAFLDKLYGSTKMADSEMPSTPSSAARRVIARRARTG